MKRTTTAMIALAGVLSYAAPSIVGAQEEDSEDTEEEKKKEIPKGFGLGGIETGDLLDDINSEDTVDAALKKSQGLKEKVETDAGLKDRTEPGQQEVGTISDMSSTTTGQMDMNSAPYFTGDLGINIMDPSLRLAGYVSAYTFKHYSLMDSEKTFYLDFAVDDSDSNLIDLTLEVRFEGHEMPLLIEHPIWQGEGTRKISTRLRKMNVNLEELNQSAIKPEYGLRENIPYEMRLVAVDSKARYDETSWIPFVMYSSLIFDLKKGMPLEVLPAGVKVPENYTEPGLEDRVAKRVETYENTVVVVVEDVVEKAVAPDIHDTSYVDEFYTTMDSFFTSGIAEYASRNHLNFNDEDFEFDPNNRTITFDGFYGAIDVKYVFSEDGSIKRNETNHTLGEHYGSDQHVTEALMSSMSEIQTQFENHDNSRKRYLIADPSTETYQQFSMDLFALGIAFRLYEPNNKKAKDLIEQVDGTDLEYRDGEVLYAIEGKQGSVSFGNFPVRE